MRVPKRKSEERVQRESGPFLITKEGLEKLKGQLASLQKKLPQMIADVEHTKSHGDFSENAAYQDAKATLRRANYRVLTLKDRIKSAIIIEKSAGDTVQVGSKVLVEKDGKSFEFEILGSHESAPASGRISNVSPLGKALMDKKVGDEAAVNLPSGPVIYKILEIR